MSVSTPPEGYHTVTPYLIVDGAARAIDFYRSAFGAEELMRLDGPGGQIMHAEIRIGDSPVMLADEVPEMDWRGPNHLGGSGVGLVIYVEDAETAFNRAVDAGAEVVRSVETHFYGDRSGTVKDPYGHVWTLATHVEDVSPEEMQRRLQEMMERGTG